MNKDVIIALDFDSKERCFVITEIPYSVYTDTICAQLEEIVKQASQSPEPVLFLNGIFPSSKRAYFAVDLTQE